MRSAAAAPGGDSKRLLRRLPGAEVVLTGRDPQPQWLRQADYVTEMRAVRHPYDQGCPARPGVEY